MKSVQPVETTRVLAKDQPEFNNLCIADRVDPKTGQAFMLSGWQPDMAELETLRLGGRILLEILGNPHLSQSYQPATRDLALLAAGGTIIIRIEGDQHPPIRVTVTRHASSTISVQPPQSTKVTGH